MTFHKVSLSEIVFELQILHTIEGSPNVGYNPSVLFNHPSLLAGTHKIMLRMGKNWYNHFQIVCVTYPNILKMGVLDGYHEKFWYYAESSEVLPIYIENPYRLSNCLYR